MAQSSNLGSKSLTDQLQLLTENQVSFEPKISPQAYTEGTHNDSSSSQVKNWNCLPSWSNPASNILNIEVSLRAPFRQDFAVKIHRRRKVLELKSMVKYRLESMENEKVAEIESLAFQFMGKDVCLNSRFCELFSDKTQVGHIQIEVRFELKPKEDSPQAKPLANGIPEIGAYSSTPNQIELYRM